VEYQALYRKYRPQRFDQIIGQRHVTDTLAREVADDKVAHAYLFAGPRGTGKTTTARIIAKALNCESRSADGEPDNECPSCVAITGGISLDVIELDAASHNKVEDVREIRVNAGTVASVGGAQRIYILDEAHMLSRAAGNALLKILEEPPEHVRFVMATTEPYKLLDTVRSRAQRFDFHPINGEVLISHLQMVGDAEGFAASPDALGLIAEHANGSVRDALGLLEQVAALGEGKVESDLVVRALGLADQHVFSDLVDAIASQDAPGALALVSRMAASGADLRRFVADALGFFRGLFLAQYTPNLEEVVDESSDTIEGWREHAKSLSSVDVLRAIDQLSDALMQLREGREERLVVELAVLRLARPETAVDPASLAARLDRLEDRARRSAKPAEGGVVESSSKPAAAPVAATGAAPAVESTTAVEPEAPFEAAQPQPVSEMTTDGTAQSSPVPAPDLLSDLELSTFEATWPALVARVRDDAGPRRHALFKETTPSRVEAGVVTLTVPSHLPFHLEQLRHDEELRVLAERTGAELLGGAIAISYEAGDAVAVAPVVEPTKAPEASEMASEGAAADPTDLMRDILGGEVVEEPS